MCQLIFVNTRNKKLNQLLLLDLLYTDTREKNKDGFGFFGREFGIVKTDFTPENTINLGELIGKLDFPTIAHVRQTSYINKSKEKAGNEGKNNHPFRSKDFILAHNGTLTPKDWNIRTEYNKSNMIDSEFFLKKLQENYGGNFVDAIKKTTDMFYGKFAFLIYEKKNDKFYAVTGETAPLHISFVKENKGYIINTEEDSLKKVLILYKNQEKLLLNSSVEFKEPTKLEENSIFLLEKSGIKKIGSVEEEKEYAIATVNAYSYGKWSNQTTYKKKENLNFLEKCFDVGMSLFEIDIFSKEKIKKSISLLDRGEFRRLEESFDRLKNIHYSIEKQKIWEDLLEIVSEPTAYFDVKVPYFTETFQKLELIKKGMEEPEDDKNIIA